jgi:hypothetical protein
MNQAKISMNATPRIDSPRTSMSRMPPAVPGPAIGPVIAARCKAGLADTLGL